MNKTISEIKELFQTDIISARNEALLLLNAVEAQNDINERAEVYHLMGLLNYYDNKSKDAISWYNKGLKLRERLKDMQGASDLLNNLGAIYYQRGRLDKAKLFYQKALTYRENINDKRGIAAVYNNLGGILIKLGKAAEAFAMHSKALEINRELGDAERISANLQNIGHTYLSQSDYDLALSHFREALVMANETNNKKTAILIMINIGATLLKQNKTAEGKKYYEQCYEESKSINYHYGLILSLQSLAHIEQMLGHYEASIKYNTDCIRIAETTEHIAEITTSLSGIGMSYGYLKDYDQALKYLHDALVMARKTGIKESIADIYLHLSEIYERLADYKKSLEYYRKHISLHNDLVNKETTKTISEIKTRYEVEKNEKEAQLLKEKNEAINLYAKRLEASNNSLKQFAHVASHDLREPLRMVSSYMGLLQRSMGHDITADQKQFIAFAVDGAKRMDTLIHDLLRLAKVDANPRITQVSLAAVVEEVKSNIEILLREKNAEVIMSELPTIMADRSQVIQLFQNIIGNGIKYNESSKPSISVGCQTNDTTATLSIADNGIGIPAEYREKAFQVFQRVPTAKEYQGSGIGLAICKKIADGLGGTIAIEDRDGGGSVFKIQIPASILSQAH